MNWFFLIPFAVRKTVCANTFDIMSVFTTENSIVEDMPMRTGENIYKRKDGRWEARYAKGRDESGRIIYGFCYGRTYSAAKEKAEKAKQQNTQEKLPEKRQMDSLGSLCEEWLSINRLRLKESTYVKYQSSIRKYIKPNLGTLAPGKLDTEAINQFTSELLYTHGLSPKTVKDILLLLHSILKYANKQALGISAAPEIIYPKDSPTEMRVLSTDEQAQVTNYLLTDLNDCKLGTLLALWTGVRIGELCALRWDHICLDSACIRIDATMQRLKDTRPDTSTKTRVLIDTPKSMAAVRVIPINPQAVELCRRIQPQSPTAFVLTGTQKYMEPRVLQYHFQRYMADCGLKGVHFHTLRHTFATRCVEVGFEIKSLSEILGHANTAITLNRYVHCSMTLKRENMKKLQTV